MREEELLKRITVNPSIFGGKPIIRGKRIAVEHILGMLAAGSTIEELLEGYPFLEKEDIQACLVYAYRLIAYERIEPAITIWMKFLLDSCISQFAVKDLRDAGLEVLWIPEIGEDPGDEAIIKKALVENFVLVTMDKDFGELVFVFDMPHPAIIRLVDIPAKEQGKMLLRLVETYKDDIEKRALITVDRSRVRIRLPKENL